MFSVADLGSVLGDAGFRAVGIDPYNIGGLGVGNLRALHHFLVEAIHAAMARGDRDELHAASRARTELDAALRSCTVDRPVLPRLRIEHFAVGDPVVVYLGDTFEGLTLDWAPGRVVSVTKSFKPEFSADPKTRGFYWRVEAEVEPVGVLAFSTSEPRVLGRDDLAALLAGFEEDLRFVATFVDNANRDWPPIWHIERGAADTWEGGALPYARWLLRGRLHPSLRGLRPFGPP